MSGAPPPRWLRLLLVVGVIVAMFAFAVFYYAALWWLTGRLWWRLDVLLGWA